MFMVSQNICHAFWLDAFQHHVPYQSVLKSNVIYFPTSYFRHLFSVSRTERFWLNAVNISRQQPLVETTIHCINIWLSTTFTKDERTPCWKTKKKIFWKFFSVDAYWGSMYWIFLLNIELHIYPVQITWKYMRGKNKFQQTTGKQ